GPGGAGSISTQDGNWHRISGRPEPCSTCVGQRSSNQETDTLHPQHFRHSHISHSLYRLIKSQRTSGHIRDHLLDSRGVTEDSPSVSCLRSMRGSVIMHCLECAWMA